MIYFAFFVFSALGIMAYAESLGQSPRALGKQFRYWIRAKLADAEWFLRRGWWRRLLVWVAAACAFVGAMALVFERLASV